MYLLPSKVLYKIRMRTPELDSVMLVTGKLLFNLGTPKCDFVKWRKNTFA